VADDLEALERAHRLVADAHRAYAERLRRTGEFPGDLTRMRDAERQLAMVRASVARDGLRRPKSTD
jgi:hypothetical protein